MRARPHRRPPRRRFPFVIGRRRPIVYWSVTVGLAAVTGLTVTTVAGHAAQDMAAWGTDEVVAVAARDLPPGTELGADDVRWEPRPVAVVPATAVVTADGTTLAGRVVVAGIIAGEAVVTDRLAPDGRHGLAALMPADTRAISVPPDNRRLAVHVTDQVDVWRGSSRAGVGTTPAAALVARSATVVDVADDGTVTVAVAADEAPDVAAAVIDGSVVVALTNR